MSSDKEEREELQERIKKRGGDPFPQQEFDGPGSADRGCTDVIFLLFFAAFWVGMVVIAGIAFSEGRPERLWKGYDFKGDICGSGPNWGKEKLYYPLPPRFSYSVCLAECPPTTEAIFCAREEWASAELKDVECTTKLDNAYLVDNPTEAHKAVQCLTNYTTLLTNPDKFDELPYSWCFPTYPSGPIKIRGNYGRCFPDPFGIVNISLDKGENYVPTILDGNETVATGNFSYTDLGDVYENPELALTMMVTNVANNWTWILMSGGVALVVCVVYTQILRFAAGIVAWTTLIAMEVVLCGLAGLFLYKAGVLDAKSLPDEFSAKLQNQSGQSEWALESTEEQRKIVLAMGIIAAVAAAFGFLFIIVMCSRINLAIRVIKEASRCISAVPMLLFFPILTYAAIIALFAWWLAVFLYIWTAGKFNDETKTYQLDDTLKKAAIYHFFGLLWTRSFILALSDITMAGAVAQWYWRREFLEATVFRSFFRTLRYHIGTAAFGSFIIALVEFVRAVVRYYTTKMKDLEKKSKIIYAIRCCTECCLACLERFLKFASRQAYIQTAIHGTNFCRSAMVAFSLLLRNTLRLVAISVVSSVFLNMGKIFVALLTSLIGAYFIVNAAGGGLSDVSNADPLSVILIFLLAFAVASAFMSVYETVIDALFQCFCEDSERSGGSASKADREFSRFMDEHKTSEKEEEDAQL